MNLILVLVSWLVHVPNVVEKQLRVAQAHEARVERLRQAAHELPDLDANLIDDAVDAALEVETRTVRAELLLSIAWGESRFKSDQRTGIVCGALQVNPTDLGESRFECVLWAIDTRLGFAAGVRELETMLGDTRVRGDLRKALLYRACGNTAFDGTCSKTGWPGYVLERARALSAPRARPAS